MPHWAVFIKKENVMLAQRIKILDWHHANGRNQTKTVKHFHEKYPNLLIKQPLVLAWLKNEPKWWEEWAQGNGAHTAKCTHQTQHPEITK
jgi:hypothetical protein